MDWKALKTQLQDGHYDLVMKGAFGKTKTVSLTMVEGKLTFKSLGTGSMKRVVKVDNEDWVLALAGDSPGAEKDMIGEVSTLMKLGANHIRVPKPFTKASEKEVLFKLEIFNEDIGDSVTYPAFIQEYLPFVEMDKLQPRENFAKDKILVGGKRPGNISTTVTDLTNIKDYFATHGEWGDFQVMYQRVTGYVFVFDPLPTNQSGVSAAPVVDRWLEDIANAKD